MHHQLKLLPASLLLLCTLLGTRAQFPNGACTIEGSTCEIADNNLVGIANDVSNVAECREGSELNQMAVLVLPSITSSLSQS